jgi:predicted lysophospholipase L1 biosynthesis ABC-type transport system permease subunit
VVHEDAGRVRLLRRRSAAAVLTELGAFLLALTLVGLWSYGMARAGVYAAVRHVTAKHDSASAVCLKCLRKELEKHAAR